MPRNRSIKSKFLTAQILVVLFCVLLLASLCIYFIYEELGAALRDKQIVLAIHQARGVDEALQKKLP